MRRSTPIVVCCALILLLGVVEALAGAAGGTPPGNSKSTGPAVNGTILITPPPHSGTLPPTENATVGTFAIRLTKGTLHSGAVVTSTRVGIYGKGCTVDSSVIANRFLGGPSIPGGLLSQYFDDSAVLTEIFKELGITIVPTVYEPIITDVNNAACSPPESSTSDAGTLSLDVTIQFVTPK